MDMPDIARVDRSAFEVGNLTDPSGDREYWLSRTVRERLEAAEMLRQIAYGYDPTTQRLQRSLEVAQLERR